MTDFCRLVILVFLFTGGITSCSDIAFDGQEYDRSIITEAQLKSIYRECQDLPNNTQVAISLIDNGRVKFYGIRRLDDTLYTVDNSEAVFEVGSISKVFTATLLADLVLQGKIRLEDTVNNYLNISFKDSITLTFQRLANHTSGLPRMPSNISYLKVDLQNPYKDYGESKLEEYLTREMELEEPGKYRYSNLGACLLGFTLSKITEASYEDLLQSRIFSKYQMTSSTSDKSLVSSKLVKGLNKKGETTSNWDLNVFVGAGGVLSSVSDLSKFAVAQFDKSNEALALTRKSTYQGYQRGSPIGVGLGWVIKEKMGREMVWHNGATGGYSAFMQVDVDNRNAVIILTNISGFSGKKANMDALGDRLMDSLEN